MNKQDYFKIKEDLQSRKKEKSLVLGEKIKEVRALEKEIETITKEIDTLKEQYLEISKDKDFAQEAILNYIKENDYTWTLDSLKKVYLGSWKNGCYVSHTTKLIFTNLAEECKILFEEENV